MTLNQPAGHLEPNESLVDAVIRETQEETAWTFVPEALVGIYRWIHPEIGETFIRYSFCGQVSHHDATQALDADINQALWLSLDEIKQRHQQHRGPLVARCFEDYLAGDRYPLELLRN